MEAFIALLGAALGVALFYAGFRLGWLSRDRVRPLDEQPVAFVEPDLPEPFELDSYGRFVPEE